MVDGNGHDQFECNITAFILRDVSQNIFFFFWLKFKLGTS